MKFYGLKSRLEVTCLSYLQTYQVKKIINQRDFLEQGAFGSF